MKNIIILRPGALGDVLVCRHLLASLRTTFPEARLTFVAPGEKTYCALWLPARKALPESQYVSLSLELSAEPSEAKALALKVKNARIIQNYPDFATVSGSLWNESGEECPLNVVYTAFYDSAGELLGVFHFTKNAGMYADEFKNFVVHMQPLPIENLAANTASIETHAFGIE